MKRPDKTSQVYNPLACAQSGYTVRDYLLDMELYVDHLEKRIEELEKQWACVQCPSCKAVFGPVPLDMREDGPIISTKKIDKAWKKSSGEEGAVTIWINAADLGIVGCGGCGGSGHIAPDFDYKIDDTCTKCHGHGWRMSDE